MKEAEKALMNAHELYEMGRSDFYAATYCREAAVKAFRTYLDAHGVEYPQDRPGINSVATLLPLACDVNPGLRELDWSVSLDWWPMPPANPGEAVPAVAQFLCASPETAEQAIGQAARILNTLKSHLNSENGFSGGV